MSRESASKELPWLRQVARDRALPRQASGVAAELTANFNWKHEHGWARPAVGTIARNLGIEEQSARTSLNKLCERGHLERVIGGGRGGTNKYRLILKPPNNAEGIEPEKQPETQALLYKASRQ